MAAVLFGMNGKTIACCACAAAVAWGCAAQGAPRALTARHRGAVWTNARANPAALPNPLAAGYHIGGSMDPEKIDAGYDLLLMAFLWLEKGITSPGQIGAWCRNLVPAARRRRQVVLVSVGGNAGSFFKLSESPDAREAFAGRILEEVESQDYDGVDVDWEHPDTPDAAGRWGELIRVLRRRLDERAKRVGRKMLLTIAISPLESKWKYLGVDPLIDCVDYVLMMCYDGNGERAQYHAAVNADPESTLKYSFNASMDQFVNTMGYGKWHILVGLPFYGYVFPGAKKPNDYVGWNKLHQSGYKDFIGNINPATVRYDSSSKGTRAFTKNGDALIYYDSVRSIEEKTEFYLRQGYRGVFCWAVKMDPDGRGRAPLTKAMIHSVKTFKK